MIPVTITPQSINLFLDGRMRTISKTHINYEKVASTIRSLTGGGNDTRLLADLRAYVDIPSFIAKVTEGRVKVGDAGVMFDGEQVKGVIADRLLTMLQNGFDVRPLAKFLDRLKQNPTLTVIDEVYLWLESGNLPITEDGCFLAFKVVQGDFASWHLAPDGSKVYNRPGETVSMERTEVDDNRQETCSRGLHFCSWQYLPSFYCGQGEKVVVVKVAPEDVVAIPYDYNNSKGRTWRYVVLSEVPHDECEHLFTNKPVVSAFGAYDSGSDDEASIEDDDVWLDDPEEDYVSGLDDDCECTDHCVATDPECSLYDGTPVSDPCCDGIDGTEQIFTHRGNTWTETQVKENVADFGQRGWSAMSGVPRTTIQEWLKRID